MVILNSILLILFYTLTPALIIYLCNRYKWLGAIGPIMVLYGIGMLFGNVSWMGNEMIVAQEIATSATIPLAIPMMLFGSHFTYKEVGMQLRVVVSGFLSVAIAVMGGYLLLGRHVPEGAEVGGIISGMYTGGTLNAAAIQQMLSIDEGTFTLINSYDIIISFLYFVFLFSVGIKMFRALYGQSRKRVVEGTSADEMQSADMGSQYHLLFERSGLKQLAKIVAVTLVIVALSAVTALAFSEEWFMVVFILMLTMLGVASSFVKRVREMTLSYDVGMYLIYIFSLTIASMADFSSLDLRGGINQFAFMTVAVILSLLIHAVVCRLMLVDADSMMISSVAFINSPPFVPMAAVAMRNKSVIVTGLGAGIMGYALGNHLGVLMSELLSLL